MHFWYHSHCQPETDNRNDNPMAGQHDLEKHQIAVKFHHKLWRQIEKAAEKKEMTPGEYIRWVTTESVGKIPLSAQDAQIVADRIRLAEERGKMV